MVAFILIAIRLLLLILFGTFLVGFLVSNYWIGFGVTIAVALIIKRLNEFKTVKKYEEKMKKAKENECEKPRVITTEDGFEFRDLNKNGKLDIYEDSRQPIEARVEDLLSQMNVEEKVGLMFNVYYRSLDINKKPTKNDHRFGLYMDDLIYNKKMNTITTNGSSGPKKSAEFANAVQDMASKTRLGIPMTIATDPRHHYDAADGTGASQDGISRWPEATGLAAMRNSDLVEKFGDIARREYRAQGVHMLLGPMADLCTEPRWGRTMGTFCERADLAGELSAAFVRGFQGKEIGTDSALSQIKHFPGGGPQKDGWDAHFPYGPDQVYPGNNFEYHMDAFTKSFDAGVAQVMPYYGRPIGLEGIEEVGFGFNKDVLTGILRNRFKFDGVIATDFTLITDDKMLGVSGRKAKAWGMEKCSREERMLKCLDAGVDQFGGESCTELLNKLVKEGKVTEERLDESCRRILRDKFRIGLFDNPYVDPEKAEEICGCDEFVNAGIEAQQKSLVLVKNGIKQPVLPLKKGIKIYAESIKDETLKQYGEVVSTIEEADIAILHLQTPYRKRYGYIYDLTGFMRQGRLDFEEKERERILGITKQIPTIISITLDRAAVMPEIAKKAEAIIGDFGCEQSIILDAIFGAFSPTGKLPFGLPKSMEVVESNKSDVPSTEEECIYPYGFGLSYNN